MAASRGVAFAVAGVALALLGLSILVYGLIVAQGGPNFEAFLGIVVAAVGTVVSFFAAAAIAE